MHKIKEMLHKDSEDNNVHRNNDKVDLKHSHSHGRDAHLDHGAFQHNHVNHGEIEHGLTTKTVTREVIHEHGREGDLHKHKHEHLHREGDLHREKHVYHEREVMRDGGNLYRDGVDPTLERHVISESRHDGGVSRSVVGEAQIVKEKIKEVELHKVQPVIHRDREQKEIRHIVEPHQQSEVKATKIEHLEKDIDLGTRREASTLETSRAVGSAPHIESSREFLGTERQHQELGAKIEEHVHRKVEEHIHPVIYKETLKPRVTEEVHHLYETVKERPIETYEVKEVHIHGDGKIRDAERAFFSEQTSRGIEIGDASHSIHSHSHSHSHDLHKDRDLHLHKDRHLHSHGDHAYLRDHSGHTTERVIEREVLRSNDGGLMQEPIVGHHQNIGAHHLPAGAVPAGHNTAYDAALCNQCTANPVCSHSEKDATLMQKMNEKKIAKDEKLEDKLARKAAKGKLHKSSAVV